MPADATSIMESFAAELLTVFPSLDGPSGCPTRIYLSKRQSAGSKPPLSGWVQGFQAPCFVISADDEVLIDKYGTFEQVSTTNPILLEYCKNIQSQIVPWTPTVSVNDGPSAAREDPDIRTIIQAGRQALYRPYIPPLTGMDFTERMVDVELRQRRTYEVDGTLKVTASGMQFWFTVWEPRAD
jgi:hypothetical protein